MKEFIESEIEQIRIDLRYLRKDTDEKSEIEKSFLLEKLEAFNEILNKL